MRDPSNFASRVAGSEPHLVARRDHGRHNDALKSQGQQAARFQIKTMEGAANLLGALTEATGTTTGGGDKTSHGGDEEGGSQDGPHEARPHDPQGWPPCSPCHVKVKVLPLTLPLTPTIDPRFDPPWGEGRQQQRRRLLSRDGPQQERSWPGRGPGRGCGGCGGSRGGPAPPGSPRSGGIGQEAPPASQRRRPGQDCHL